MGPWISRIVAVSVSTTLIAWTDVAAAAERATAVSQRGLLATPQRIQRQVDAARDRQVRRALNLDLRIGEHAQYLTPDELRSALGLATPGLTDQPREGVEVYAWPGVRESPREAQIPFGLAGIAWGVRHPSASWRLVLPVVG